MSNLKILATIVGLTTAVILITQLSNNGSAEPLVEHWLTGGPSLGILQETAYTCNKTGKNSKDPRLSGGRKLTGHLPESAFFGNNLLQPSTVIGATNMEASPYSTGNAGSYVQYRMNANPSTTPAQLFNNFTEAAGAVEPYCSRSESAPPIESCNKDFNALSSPAGCGPAGTIASGYGLQQANALGVDYSPMNSDPVSLPVSHMNAYSVPQGNLETLDAEGNLNSHFMTSRLMYSTLKRARCNGVADMIRGDLAIIPQQTCGMSAARPGDTLESGAFAAIFGSYATTPQETAALISADTMSMRTALGGADQVNEVMQGVPEPVLTASTFIPTSASMITGNLAASQKSVGTDVLSGNVQGNTGIPLLTGYTSY